MRRRKHRVGTASSTSRLTRPAKSSGTGRAAVWPLPQLGPRRREAMMCPDVDRFDLLSLLPGIASSRLSRRRGCKPMPATVRRSASRTCLDLRAKAGRREMSRLPRERGGRPTLTNRNALNEHYLEFADAMPGQTEARSRRRRGRGVLRRRDQSLPPPTSDADRLPAQGGRGSTGRWATAAGTAAVCNRVMLQTAGGFEPRENCLARGPRPTFQEEWRC